MIDAWQQRDKLRAVRRATDTLSGKGDDYLIGVWEMISQRRHFKARSLCFNSRRS